MECPHCKSSKDLVFVNEHISKPIGAKKLKCLSCNQTFITNPTVRVTAVSHLS